MWGLTAAWAAVRLATASLSADSRDFMPGASSECFCSSAMVFSASVSSASVDIGFLGPLIGDSS